MIVIPGDHCNAIELSLAIELLVRCGYRVYRTTNWLEVYKQDGDRGNMINGNAIDEKPLAHLRCDIGYFSDTWYDRDGTVGVNRIWDEVCPSTNSVLFLVYRALVKDDWRPESGWMPSKGGEKIGSWWEVTEHMATVDLPLWLSVKARR